MEPNEYFAEALAQKKDNYNITFTTNTVWLKGGDVDVEPNSFDAVVATHVLCSVGDTEIILKQVSRALKPGGTFYFMEHVASGTKPFIRYIQYAIGPFFYIVGNGCEFKETWEDIRNSHSLRDYDLKLEHFEAKMLLPMSPHIIGTASKPLKA